MRPKHLRSLRKTASAMKPASQKSVVSDSKARIMAEEWLAPALGKRAAASAMDSSASSVQTELKKMKLIWLGELPFQ